MTGAKLIVPVKALSAGKSRLGDVLDRAERAALNRRFLDHILSVAAAFPGAASTWVISRDAEVLETARARGANAIPETTDGGLNAALTQALSAIDPEASAGVLVLHADLPNLAAEDARALCRPPLALAPDARDEGTNGLFMAAGRRIPFRFGRDSFARHLAECRARDIRPVVVRRPGLAFDVDTSAEYDRLTPGPER